MNFTTDLDFNYSNSWKVNKRLLVLSECWNFVAKYDMQLVRLLVKMRPIIRNLIMKNGLKKTRDHYKRKLKGLWTKQNWSYVYFDHDHVCKIPCLVPMPPPFLWKQRSVSFIVHHVSGCKIPSLAPMPPSFFRTVCKTGKALHCSSCEWMPDGHR